MDIWIELLERTLREDFSYRKNEVNESFLSLLTT